MIESIRKKISELPFGVAVALYVVTVLIGLATIYAVLVLVACTITYGIGLAIPSLDRNVLGRIAYIIVLIELMTIGVVLHIINRRL